MTYASITWHEISKALDNGAVSQNAPLPQVYIENMRLVEDNCSPQAQRFSTYLQGIAEKLLPNHDFKAHPVRFVLAEDDTVNASALTHANQTIVTFNKGMIKDCQNEDELAHNLGHELKHMRFVVELGAGANTKLEEGAATVYSVIWMHQAGYHPEAALDFSARMAQRDKKDLKPDLEWSRVFDVHPLSENDAEAIAKTLAGLNQHAGGFKDRQYRPIPADILSYVEGAKHTSYYGRRLKEVSFETMPPLKQMEFLRDELAAMPHGYIRRVKELSDTVEKIVPDDTRAERNVLNQIISQSRSNTEILALFYPAIVKNLFLLPPKTPVGEFRDVAQDIKSFIEAKTISEATHYAERMLQGHQNLELTKLDKFNLSPLEERHLIEWPKFPLDLPLHYFPNKQIPL